MADIDRKLESIEKICIETAKKNNSLLKEENDEICNAEVSKRIEEYKNELVIKYQVELNKLDRELNNEKFKFDMEERTRMYNYRLELLSDIKSNVINYFNQFIDSDEYKDYLLRVIDNILNKISSNREKVNIILTQNDASRFGDEIYNRFKLKIDIMDNSNIGGCMIIDDDKKISVDNTFKTNIEEKIQNINI